MSEENTNNTPAPVAAKSTLLKDLSIPLAIIIAGAFIGAGLFFSGTKSAEVVGGTDTAPTPVAQQDSGDTDNIAPVTEDDHIKGDVGAKVTIVEFSDFECPFCKQFHNTMNEIVAEYDDAEVAWVFRQFPLEQLHPVKAMAAAMASECVAELGGQEAFWTFTDGYFERSPANNRTDIETLIPQLVSEAGVDRAAFTACFESNRHQEAINADVQDAIATGGRGTPWSVVIGPDGSTYPLNGALPTSAVRQLIEQLLSE